MVDPHPAAVVAWNVIEKEEVIVVGIKKWQVEWVSVRNQRMGMKMKKMKKMKLRYEPRSINTKDCSLNH